MTQKYELLLSPVQVWKLKELSDNIYDTSLFNDRLINDFILLLNKREFTVSELQKIYDTLDALHYMVEEKILILPLRQIKEVKNKIFIILEREFSQKYKD